MATKVKSYGTVESQGSSSKKKTGIRSRKIKDAKPNWRVDEKYFAQSSSSRVFQRGVENYSSGWFAQGHEVRDPVMLHPTV
jgi:hypothetical protein